MKCINCGTINDNDSIFCKKCGFNLIIDNEDYLKEKEEEKRKPKKVKKIKKVKKKIVKKEKNKKPKKNKKEIEVRKEMSLFQSLLMLFLFVLCIFLFGALLILGYYTYKSKNIEVPNIVNMSYQDAEIKLNKMGLNIEKIEEETEDVSKENIILSQNKKEGTKVSAGSLIKVKVGKYIKVYYLEDFTGMNLESVKNILYSNNLKYKVIYKESKINDNIIISQKPKVNTKMQENQTVILTVSKLKEGNNDNQIQNEENDKIEQEEQKEQSDDEKEID